MVSIKTFLKSDNSTMFLEKESELEYSKHELNGEFQFTQDCGFVTIQEYYDNLYDFLVKFRMVNNDTNR